ncbi:MFS transporter [Paenibacillus nasutitermitis]|uniref:MFS transporter n=1 Tax=Paenibacillus nasutitermitis TaxID=1652958 RepID=A0A917E0D6_9BACL|nr:MFS transporter [Paenibacillus nasutitermitis]GGD84918.1 MFS transporter [Paenibacillus nasutitermitis]
MATAQQSQATVPVTQTGLKSAPDAKRKGLVFLLICFGIFMVYLDSTIVNVALPHMGEYFAANLSGMQWIVNVYTLTFACFLLTAGSLGDRWGHHKLFLAGMVGFTICSILCALSQNYELLLAGRALQGLFGSFLVPMSLALIRHLFHEPAARAKAIGLWSAIGGLALAAGPLLGGVLVENYGWQSIFWINLPVGIIVLIMLAPMIPHTAVQTGKSIDWIGQILMILSLAALTYALIEGGSRGWGSAIILLLFAAAAILLLVFLAWEASRRESLLPMSLFRIPIFVVTCIVNFLGFFGLYGVIFLMTLYYQMVHGYSATETGVRFLALTVSIMLASVSGSLLSQRFHPRSLILIGLALVAAALFALTTIHADSGYGTYWWWLSLLGIGISIAGAAGTVAMMGSVPPELAGTASGVMNTFRQISAVFGVAVSGVLVTSRLREGVTEVLQQAPLGEEARSGLYVHLSGGELSAAATAPLSAEWKLRITEIAGRMFIEGMHNTFIASGVAGLVAGALALLLLPGQRKNLK